MEVEEVCKVRHKSAEAVNKCGKVHDVAFLRSLGLMGGNEEPDYVAPPAPIADATDPDQRPLVIDGPVPGSFRMIEHRESRHKDGKKSKHGQRDHSKAKKKAAKRAAQNQRPRGKKKGKSWAK